MDVDSTTLVPTASASTEVAGSLLTQQPENDIGSEIQSVTEGDIMAKVVQEKIIQTAVTIATNTALTASIGGSVQVCLDKQTGLQAWHVMRKIDAHLIPCFSIFSTF